MCVCVCVFFEVPVPYLPKRTASHTKRHKTNTSSSDIPAETHHITAALLGGKGYN